MTPDPAPQPTEEVLAARPEESRSSANISLFLGLYLLILAFFILLVSISSFEEIKSRAVIESVNTTFANLLPTSQRLQTVTGESGDILAGRGFHRDMEGLFASAIQIEESQVLHPGRHMVMRTRASAFFPEGSTVPRDTLTPLLDRVVAALSRRPRGLMFQLELVIRAPTDAAGALPLGKSLETDRAGAFARELLARGAPRDAIAVAVRPGQAGEIDLHFLVQPQVDDPYGFLLREPTVPEPGP
ncbi:MAG: hypothetical protein ACPGO3_06650 [Magnetospiraceae bacterium]